MDVWMIWKIAYYNIALRKNSASMNVVALNFTNGNVRIKNFFLDIL